MGNIYAEAYAAWIDSFCENYLKELSFSGGPLRAELLAASCICEQPEVRRRAEAFALSHTTSYLQSAGHVLSSERNLKNLR